MKNTVLFLIKTYNVIKSWIKANDVEGVLGLLVGIVALIFGYNVAAGTAFGIFGTKNYMILKNYIVKKAQETLSKYEINDVE